MNLPYLLLLNDPQATEYKFADGKLTIGRHVENQVVLRDERASRRHCVIEQKGDEYVLRDLQSSNGTFVNGERITEHKLAANDTLRIGKTEFRFVVPAEEAPAAKPSGDTAVELEPLPIVESESDLPPLTLEPLEEPIDALPVEETPQTPSHKAAKPAGPAIDPEDPGLSEDDYDLAEAEEPQEDVDQSDPEAVLVRMARSMENAEFDENEIIMLNARGGITHPATPAARKREGSEAVTIFRILLLVCYRANASDIHIEPKEEEVLVRIRVDGSMVDAVRLSKELGTKLGTMVKILCDIDIAQRNIVQEGHFSARVPRPHADSQGELLRRIDYRVSFAPSVYGQKLVIRIQDSSHAPGVIEDLQLPPWMAEELHRTIEMDSGMILAVGPTGSGKTTTLYSLLRSLNVNDRNVTTIEDPVEIQLQGITQLPVQSDDPSKTFLALLKSVLRQDPDVILVGEIRDIETARTAMQAAITGHLVFSTLHTKDTVGTVYRLLDLGVEPFMLAQGLQLIIAQRLVRKLCPNCRKAVTPTAEQLARMGEFGAGVKKLYVPRGCSKCLRTGYRGRRAVFEMLLTSDALRDAIARNTSMADITKAAGEGAKFVKLLQNGYELAAEGIVSIDEVERTIGR